MRDSLNGDWIQGYTQALLDIEKLTDVGLIEDLSLHHRAFNYKTFKEFLHCFIENRSFIREKADTGAFLRCSGEGKNMKFEPFLDIRWKELNN